jgi:hypothetical protein
VKLFPEARSAPPTELPGPAAIEYSCTSDLRDQGRRTALGDDPEAVVSSWLWADELHRAASPQLGTGPVLTVIERGLARRLQQEVGPPDRKLWVRHAR